MPPLNNPDSAPDDGKIRLPRVDGGMNRIAPARDQKKDEKGKPLGQKKDKDADVLHRARKRFDRCVSHESENRRTAMRALNFVNGKQWDDGDLKSREGRPTITVNRMRALVNQVVNSERENRPAINVSPEGDRGDKQVATMLKGVIRKLQQDCGADIAYDNAFEQAVSAGWGYWRITTEYEGPDTFDQVITVEQVPNLFTVYIDPQSREPDGADMRFAFVTEMLDRGDFREQFPDADPINWEGVNRDDSYRDWLSEKQVRIAEYFEIRNEKSTLYALENGWVGTEDEMADDVREDIEAGWLDITNEREVERPVIKWYKITAKEILERREWPGRWIPIVKVIGNCSNIEGKPYYSGLVGDALDGQRMYNYWVSLQTELLALSPKAPWLVAEGQIEGYEDVWAQANQRSLPYLPYQPLSADGHPVPPPIRTPPAQVPQGIIEARESISRDIQATTGIRFDGTLHERTNDESGRALREVRRATDIGTFHFIDNLTRSLKHTGRILIDLIPHIYDTKRVMTILREDDKEETVVVDPRQVEPAKDVKHPADPRRMVKSINPKIGRYGVTVTTGPSYATKRIEAAESMAAFLKAVPQASSAVMDLVAKNMDWPDSDQFAARLAKMIPPHLHDAQNLRHLPPEAQGLIGAQQQQLQQLGMQHQAALKALNDKQADRGVQVQKNEQDFEAKLLAVIQKAQAAKDKAFGDSIAALGERVGELMDALQAHQAAVAGAGGAMQQPGQAGAPGPGVGQLPAQAGQQEGMV